MRAPSKTVQTGATAGAVVILMVWVLHAIFPALVIPDTVVAALTVIVTSVSAWIVRDPAKGTGKH